MGGNCTKQGESHFFFLSLTLHEFACRKTLLVPPSSPMAVACNGETDGVDGEAGDGSNWSAAAAALTSTVSPEVRIS